FPVKDVSRHLPGRIIISDIKKNSCINSTPPPLVKKLRLEAPTSASTSTA
ncbi:unnamed protein product, partial [Tenebrio molitor]